MSRLIIVPPPFTIDNVGHSHSLNVGNMNVSTGPQNSTANPSVDLLNDYIQHYLPNGIDVWSARTQFRSSAPGFDSGLRRCLAEQWIAQHCTLPVIAQRDESMGLQWSYYVMDGTLRRDEFYNWSLGTRVHQTQDFRIVLPEDQKIALAKEVDESIRDLVRGAKFVSHMNATIHVSIWDATDAVEFKLKWSDYFG
jgi:hypothetical protein